MCGIIGCVVKAHNGFDKKTEDSFYQMLYADALRGDDSTGVVFIEKDSSFGIMKEAYSSAYNTEEFRASKMGKSMWSFGKAMIGHNRKKTSGAVTDANAHPFVVDGKFAMVHNGTLYNHTSLANTDVDSEALAIHLSKVLNDEFTVDKLEEALGKVYGAYAIAAYNQETHRVYLTRNDQRPLSYVETPEGIFWASEAPMLWWILMRNGITLKDVKVNHIKENSLVIINLKNNEIVTIDYTPKKATPPVTKVASTGGNITATKTVSTTKARMSKNAFKLAKRAWLGKLLKFWADDYLEKNFPKTIADGETLITLMGETEQFSMNHNVYAVFDLEDIPPNSRLIDCLYTGIISDMSFDKRTGCVTFHIADATQVPEIPKIIDAKYIQEKLDENEKAVTALH